MKNFWLVLTFLVCQVLAGRLPATNLAYFQGNTFPGQLADTLMGSSLVASGSGSISNPSTPTPYEGNRWLGFDFFSTTSYFSAPLTAVPPVGEGKIDVAFRYATAPCCGANSQQTIIDLENSGTTRYMTLVFEGTNLYSDYASGGGNTHISGAPGWALNTTHVVEIGWSAAGVYIAVDGTTIASSATTFNHGTVAQFLVGTQGNAVSRYTQNYLDALATFSSIADTYPPSIAVPAQTNPIPANQLYRVSMNQLGHW